MVCEPRRQQPTARRPTKTKRGPNNASGIVWAPFTGQHHHQGSTKANAGSRRPTAARVAEVQFRTDGSDRTARTELSVQVQFWFWFGRQPAVQVRSSGFEKILRTGFEPVRTELNLYFSNPGHTWASAR